MYESLSVQEYIRKRQEIDDQKAIRLQEVLKECWEEGEPIGRFKTQKPTKKLVEALE